MRNEFMMATMAAMLAAVTAFGQGGPCPGEGSCFLANASPGCDDISCCTAICAADPFCCTTSWDGFCAGAAATVCTPACPSDCAGDLNDDGTVAGADLGILLNNWGKAGCGDLNNDGVVNGADLGALLNNWGACPLSCGDPNAGSCCEANGSPFCDDAACCLAVCAVDPFCCDVIWDNACANQAQQICDVCAPPCAHSPCVTGDALDPACDPCVAEICAVDPFCCQNSWDSVCVKQVGTICGLTCP